MAAKPCMECGRRPKMAGRHRCRTCWLRHEPIGEQVAAARRRLAMVPPELRLKRTKTVQKLAPEGTAWCAGCQTFRDLEDFARDGKATQCRPCSSATAHASMTQRVYGLTSAQYDELLALQGGRCAICRNRPGSKRFAVDHDHDTGVVRGLLCSTDNHDLLGAGYDSPVKLLAAWHYLNTPPTSGLWIPPEQGLVAPEPAAAQRPADGSAPAHGHAPALGGNVSEQPAQPVAREDFAGVLAPGWAWGDPEQIRLAYLKLGTVLDDLQASPF
jgi:hypothetical protein